MSKALKPYECVGHVRNPHGFLKLELLRRSLVPRSGSGGDDERKENTEDIQEQQRKVCYGWHDTDARKTSEGGEVEYFCKKCDTTFSAKEHCEVVRGGHYPVSLVAPGVADSFKCGTCDGVFNAMEILRTDARSSSFWKPLASCCVMRPSPPPQYLGFDLFPKAYNYFPMHDFDGYQEHVFTPDLEVGTSVCNACGLSVTRRQHCERIDGYHELHRNAFETVWRCKRCDMENLPPWLLRLLDSLPVEFALIVRPELDAETGDFVKVERVPSVDIKVQCRTSPCGGLTFECPFCVKQYNKNGLPRKNSSPEWHSHGRAGGQRIPHCINEGRRVGEERMLGDYNFHLLEPEDATQGSSFGGDKRRRTL